MVVRNSGFYIRWMFVIRRLPVYNVFMSIAIILKVFVYVFICFFAIYVGGYEITSSRVLSGYIVESVGEKLYVILFNSYLALPLQTCNVTTKLMFD